jgi:hypothetical protein
MATFQEIEVFTMAPIENLTMEEKKKKNLGKT